ncbi:MAG: ABC transporter permease, partial [Chloroflexi bacterium]|nr:ABC transporter permease [Chloroflexota bacterium]
MFTLAIQQLLTKKLRSALTVLGFGVCVNLYIVVTTVMRFITEDLDLQVQRFTGVLFVQSRGLTGLSGIEWPPISSTISMAEANDVISRPTVDQERSTKVSFAALAPPPYPTAPPEALLVGIEPGKEDVFLNGADAIAGRCRFPSQNGTGHAPPAILGVLAARHFARAATATTEVPTPVGPLALAALGSRIVVRGTEFEVQGIIEPETNQLLRSAVLVPLEDAQCVLQSPDSVTALLVSPKRASDIDPLQAVIESEHEELMVISDRQLAENARKLLDRVNQLFDVVRWTSVSVAALLIAIVMFVSVLERTRELGTLRAIGAPRRALLSLILSESAGFAVAGSMVGVPMSRVVISKALGPDAA